MRSFVAPFSSACSRGISHSPLIDGIEVSRTTAAPRGSLQRSVVSEISAKASLVRRIEPLALQRQRDAARAALEQL